VNGHLAYFKSSILLNPEEKSKLVNLILDPQDSGYPLKDCISVYQYLCVDFPSYSEEYKEKCYKLFPYSTFFGAATTTNRIGPLSSAENKLETNEE